MTSDEPRKSEQELFDELLGRSLFDDSVREEHQNDLRAKVLRAFDRCQRDAEAAGPVVTSNWNANQVVGVIAAVAVCLLCVVWLRFTRDGDSVSGPVTEFEYEAKATADPLLVASLAEVDALSEGVPPKLLFDALAMCQQEHEAREFDFNATRMRWLYELSFPELPIESPKG